MYNHNIFFNNKLFLKCYYFQNIVEKKLIIINNTIYHDIITKYRTFLQNNKVTNESQVVFVTFKKNCSYKY